MPPSPPTIRKFNPGTFQSDREVMRQFVVRHRELAATLEVLRDNIDAESCQHILLVSPRGHGKTMLLARVAAELRENPAYRDKFLPVRFMEESHEVFHIGDFWMEALFHLAKECAATEPELARELEGAHASLAKDWRGSMLDYRARATVLNAADRLDRQLVLMVENLQTLSEDVNEDFGWALRESLQMEPKVILLGTATRRFRALDDVREAFFELFRVVTLPPLDTDECSVLWEAVTGNQVERSHMRPLEILAGGSPRLLVIVADFARHRSVRQLLEELVTLVDDHTEYFRGHLEALPKTERRVYLAALGLWRPSTTGEIATRARMGVRTTSSMLGRLVDRGALTAEGPKRRKRYAATERLYCMYYKIRRERDDASVVQALIRFMTLYYIDPSSASVDAILRRTRALLLHGQDHGVEAGREAIRELYAATDMTSDENLKEMYAWIVVFGAFGVVGPGDLAELLSSDPHRAKAFWPLEVALRRMAEEDVRAPIEVMEVAGDLVGQMESLKTAAARLAT